MKPFSKLNLKSQITKLKKGKTMNNRLIQIQRYQHGFWEFFFNFDSSKEPWILIFIHSLTWITDGLKEFLVRDGCFPLKFDAAEVHNIIGSFKCRSWHNDYSCFIMTWASHVQNMETPFQHAGVMLHTSDPPQTLQCQEPRALGCPFFAESYAIWWDSYYCSFHMKYHLTSLH